MAEERFRKSLSSARRRLKHRTRLLMTDPPRTGDRHPQPPDLNTTPRFAGIPTFMRLPLVEDPATLDIALAGVPWDGGTTNRAGARHGPREVRNQSSLMRRIHHVSRIAPFELCRVGDVGDAPVNPINLETTLGNVEAFFSNLVSNTTRDAAGGRRRPSDHPADPARARAAWTAWHGAFRRPQRHCGQLFRRRALHPWHAVSPRRRGRTARPEAGGPDRHPRFALQPEPRRLLPRQRHARDHHRGVL